MDGSYPVNISLDAAPLVFEPEVEFSHGFFDLSIPIPANTTAGTHVLTATIDLGNTTRTLPDGYFDVCSICGPKLGFFYYDTPVVVNWTFVSQNSTFSLIGDNFVPTEMLTISADQGQLNSTILATNIQVDSDGHFEAVLTAEVSFGENNLTAIGSGANSQPPDEASIVMFVAEFQ
jgi:hypothetical protein